MPDLSEDLRSYFDELAGRVERRLERPTLDVDVQASGPAARPWTCRRSVLVPLLLGLAAVVALSGGIAAARRSSNAPLDVGGPTTSAPRATSDLIQVEVDPAAGLLDGDSVTVHASGFAPGQMAAIVLCAEPPDDRGLAPADCDLETLSQVPADAGGVVDTAFRLRRLIRVGGALDCGTAPRGCRIAVGPSIQPPGGGVGGAAAITFAPGPAAPLPTISVSPSTDLRDGQTVTVTGRNFAPNVDVTVTECPPNADCGYEPFGVMAHTDATGGFRQALTLHRTFVVPANLVDGGTTQQLDCTTGCTINAVEAGPASNLAAEPLPFTLIG